MNRRGMGWRRVANLRANERERSWYALKNHDSSAGAEVMIYDEIGGWGISAADFVRDLATVTASNLTVRMNTPGGEIFDGIAIYNALKSHPAHVTCVVDGIAASIGSVILQAGDKRVMMPHSTTMIHDGSGMCWGNAADMRELADLLDKLSNNIAGVYADRAGAGTVEDWRAAMLATSWYTAQEAVAAGLADEVEGPEPPEPDEPADPGEPADQWDMSVFRYRNRGEAPAPWMPGFQRRDVEPVRAADVPEFDIDAFRAAIHSTLKGK